MRTDLGLHVAVSGALRAALGATAAQVTVKVQDGVVTLTGVVNTAGEKLSAERAVERVPGVHAVVEALRVALHPAGTITDESLARDALSALSSGTHPIGRDVIIRVEDGWLVLGGSVESAAEYAAVERALECLPGARGMRSEVRIVGTGTVSRSPVAPGSL